MAFTLPILNAPAENLPAIGAVPFSFTPRPSISDDLAMLDAIGATCARVEISWAETESIQGQYSAPDYVVGRIEAIRRSGRSVILLLDYSNPIYTGGVFNAPTTTQAITAYCNFVAWVAKKWFGDDVWYEVYNEPNNPGFWVGAPQPVQYACLLKPAINAIKAVKPNAKVITAGIGEVAMDNGAVSFMGAVNSTVGADDMAKLAAHTLHPYNPGIPETIFDYIDAYRAGVPCAGQIGVTEWGYPSQWINNNETTRSIYVARMICCSIMAQLKFMTIYNLKDRGTGGTIEETFGLHDYWLKPKGAALTMKRIMDAMAGTVSYDAEKLPSGVYRIIFRKADGSVVKLFWSSTSSAITHSEPMSSVTNVQNCLGGSEPFRFFNGMLTISVANIYPVMMVYGS